MPAVFHTAYWRCFVVRVTCAVTVPTAFTQNDLSVLICEAVKKIPVYNLLISMVYMIGVSAHSSFLKQVIYGLMHVM
jgi:hypothetical protein